MPLIRKLRLTSAALIALLASTTQITLRLTTAYSHRFILNTGSNS